MKYWTRKRGSTRGSAMRTARFEPNHAGSGGLPVLIINVEGVLHHFQPESMQDVRDLLSHAHLVHANYEEMRK